METQIKEVPVPMVAEESARLGVVVDIDPIEANVRLA